MRLHRNITFTVKMRLDAEGITPAQVEKLRQRVQANAKKAGYETGILYRSVVATAEVGEALPVPESRAYSL